MHELCRYSECCYSLSVLFAELGKLGVTIYYSWMEGGDARPSIHCLYIYLRMCKSIYVPTYIKITRQWKSTLTLPNEAASIHAHTPFT